MFHVFFIRPCVQMSIDGFGIHKFGFEFYAVFALFQFQYFMHILCIFYIFYMQFICKSYAFMIDSQFMHDSFILYVDLMQSICCFQCFMCGNVSRFWARFGFDVDFRGFLWFIRTSSGVLTWFIRDTAIKISPNFSQFFHAYPRMNNFHLCSGCVT